MELTNEQAAAISARGKVIVSASAGSGKTFVMIEKLVNAVCGGADLDEVLAVTFTKKAAAQMKEKLRKALIEKIAVAGEEKPHLKTQLSKVSSANISTIHSLCARLIRTYFYVLGADSGFDIISADDAVASDLKARALDNLFEQCYERDDSDFKLLLKCFMKKRNDGSLRRLISEAYSSVRSTAHYTRLLENAGALYTEKGFNEVCVAYRNVQKPKFMRLKSAVEKFQAEFPKTAKAQTYQTIFEEMKASITFSAESPLFAAKPALCYTRKPADGEDDKPAGELFKKFKEGILKKYNAIHGDLSDEGQEKEKFFQSGRVAAAFSNIILQFDREYAAVKAEENKLDYNDLEHLTLELLSDESVKNEINSSFKYVFVDEYQDVNPVQEEIISSFSGETFLVGDVKQAIYGFRGSKSVFFSEKFKGFERAGGTALRLSSNFRSADGVLDFVNGIFTDIMQKSNCGIDYKNDGKMSFGGLYPRGYGYAAVRVFGADGEEERETGIYSVKSGGSKKRHTREGLAVLKIVEEELKGQHYDLKTGGLVDTKCGDICILTRKNKGGSTDGIVRALLDEGYSVAGAQEANICNLPEVKQVLDILSLIDNAEQDLPLIAALLSPLGGLCEDELAAVRLAADGKSSVPKSRLSFRKCCEEYRKLPGVISRKLNDFQEKLNKLRGLAGILNTGELVDELLENYGLESAYGAGGERKLKNVLRLVEEGATLPLAGFLEKIKAGGYNVSAPAPAPSDSIKIMSMHASKGLEFPVVIISDICRTFKGQDYEEVPFDEKYGFAPKFYDSENMLVSKTLLRRLVKARADGEELKNELNLFYVACTRAMCKLHVLAEKVKEFSQTDAGEAKCYANLFDISKFNRSEVEPHAEIDKKQDGVIMYRPDPELVEKLESRFNLPYSHADSVDLPVKSSASAILKTLTDEPQHIPHKLFGGEGETGTDIGTAYHRFLELCDFSVKTEAGIKAQKDKFLQSGKITAAQHALLNDGKLSEILNMPVFTGLENAQLYREREFLCRLPANQILETPANDLILVQGAIDLIAVSDSGVKIIDYKYSKKSDGQLKADYSRQLDLYKKATSLIEGISADEISTVIVNLYSGAQINLS